jgi:hypothetical protein
MPVYTVHAPNGYGTDVRASADKIVLVRDGFYVWAFLLGPFWLLWHRLWLALVGYLVLQFGLERALSVAHVAPGARFVIMFIVALLFGLEAGSLRRWKLSRGRWRQINVVAAENKDAAERRFFNRATIGQQMTSSSSMPPLPRASLVARDASGFFPMPGSSQ